MRREVSAHGRRATASFFGTGSLPASSASSPKVSARLEAVCRTLPSRVSIPAGATFHRFEAAAISMARPVAPTRRRSSSWPRIDFEPSVFWSPYFASPSAWTIHTRAMSAPSSSAMRGGIELRTP